MSGSASRKIDIHPKIAERSEVFAEMTRTHVDILKALKNGGLEITLDQVFVPMALGHVMSHDRELVCVPFRGTHGYDMLTGVTLPEGEHPDRPNALDVYVSIENKERGVRFNKRTNHPLWHAVFWSSDGRLADIGHIRRDIIGGPPHDLVRDVIWGRVVESLHRIALLYMTGLWSARLA